MSEIVFVEEYRKELEQTGYPFVSPLPLTTATGFLFPLGGIANASVYFDSMASIPKLTALEKTKHFVRFIVGDFLGVFDLRSDEEIVSLWTEEKIFGGILVCNPKKLQTLKSWPSGLHSIREPLPFCPAALEFLPPVGVQRFRADTGEVFSGDTAIVSGKGGVLETKKASSNRFDSVRVHFCGDPTRPLRDGETDYTVPIQEIVCIGSDGQTVTLAPGTRQEISLLACNTQESNLYDDALRISASGSSVTLSLAGL
jgi:hypothetical protein